MMYNFCLQPAFIQIMPLEDAYTYCFDPFDVTKVWPHKGYPLTPFGKLVLNRFVQAGDLYRLLSEQDHSNLIHTIAVHIKHASRDIQIRQVKLFYRADPEYGTCLAEKLGIVNEIIRTEKEFAAY